VLECESRVWTEVQSSSSASHTRIVSSYDADTSTCANGPLSEFTANLSSAGNKRPPFGGELLLCLGAKQPS
jgi:hypothetical protein